MYTIRAMIETDQDVVKNLAVSTGLFELENWDHPNLKDLQDDHLWLVALSESDDVVGAAYIGPEAVSQELWNTFFLAIKKEMQGKGVGSFIMGEIESMARSKNIKTLIVETSSQDSYAPARGFYQSLGYIKEAEIRDYYGAGDNKITFWKSLQ